MTLLVLLAVAWANGLMVPDVAWVFGVLVAMLDAINTLAVGDPATRCGHDGKSEHGA